MGRRSIPSTSLAATVRKYFGLTQTELGQLLHLTRGQVAHVEAGRHLFSPATEQPLLALAASLPVANEPADPAAHLAPPDAAPLAARLDYCQHHAAQLRREQAALTQEIEVARRWQQALPPLLAQAPDVPARAWLLRRQEQAAADLDGETAARYHLLRLRAEALEAEAAGLAALLPPAG
ncbi:helix-turn-helix domain-containing protein [Hymenobacter psoromatis]|uniref:helix-turn-helix domain-containing protein n=1 Tax=Hymenobacter psoromatis TaxID=1484116 RepID=UPI001CBCD5B9|nr:helix-turn-helix transcriptional regulator [Hymenobacter psoromatis]